MATSLADFHQMIKLFGADADEINGGQPATTEFVEEDDDDDDR